MAICEKHQIEFKRSCVRCVSEELHEFEQTKQGWIAWNGAKVLPAGLARDARVEVMLRNGQTATAPLEHWVWEWGTPNSPHSGSDIVSYRLVREATDNPAQAKKALDVQVGGGHYKDMKIQPIEYIHANGIPFAEGSVIKYVSRWRAKGGVEDLKKARHFLDLLIDLESKEKN